MDTFGIDGPAGRTGRKQGTLFPTSIAHPKRYYSLFPAMGRRTAEKKSFAAAGRSPCALFERVEISVRAAEIDNAIDDERRRKNRTDAELLIGRGNGRFPPVRMEKERIVEATLRC